MTPLLEVSLAATAPRVAEFFAGMGLVRMAVEEVGYKVVFANDISETKRVLYGANFGVEDFLLKDIREVHAEDVPDVALATASFPCTDLSLAGNRAGFGGSESSLVVEFLRILTEMGERRPNRVLLENVVGLATSRGGDDLAQAIAGLNRLSYTCDIVMVDARWFVPQSRPRVFIVATIGDESYEGDWRAAKTRPAWISRFVEEHPELRMRAALLPEPPGESGHLSYIVESFPPNHSLWWSGARHDAFLSSLSPIQAERLTYTRYADYTTVATAYRRTRSGKPTWEIRPDDIAGCLRTGRGGSSRQAVLEAGHGDVRVRWMTAREYARLQGAPNADFGPATDSQARFALGDAVCVPAVAWLVRHCFNLAASEEAAKSMVG